MSAEAVLHAALHTRAPWAAVDGLFDHPAGLSPDAARLLLGLLPAGTVLDPFVGGGAVALAARRAGRRCIGRDVSAAALCVTRARCWSPGPAEANRYRAAVDRLSEVHPARLASDELPATEPLRSAVQATLAATAQPRARRRRAAAAVRAWEAEHGRVPPGTPAPDLQLADARTLQISTPVAGVLTSPPYPGVYDYDRWTEALRASRGQSDDLPGEIGTRRGFDDGMEAATAAWRRDTLAWTRAVAAAMLPGGRMVIVIGDGPRPDGPIDTRRASIHAADLAGLDVLAVATAAPGSRPSPRREHALLLARRPGA